MENINLWHIAKSNSIKGDQTLTHDLIDHLRVNEGYFTLDTCQRYILVSRNEKLNSNVCKEAQSIQKMNGPEAYQFLLETICGLKSRLLGETEIVGQFKEGFENYLDSKQRDPRLIKIFHKLFMDAKKIRSEHLKNIGLLSYCGLTKKLVKEHIRENDFHHLKKISILGSGKLAHDLIKVLNKNYELNIHARNESVLEEIKNKYKVKTIHGVDQKDLIDKSIIINTIGTERTILDHQFFKSWKSTHTHRIDDSLFVDLSSPSVIETSFGKLNAVFRLDDLFAMAKEMHEEKEKKVTYAHQAISDLTNHRMNIFSPSNDTGWEEKRFV